MRRAARTDTTAKALRAYAESIGFGCVHLGGVVDCALWYGTKWFVVDWKGEKGGALTPAQAKLVGRGAPILFISRAEQLEQLKAEVSR
jgi:hypothetical protein